MSILSVGVTALPLFIPCELDGSRVCRHVLLSSVASRFGASLWFLSRLSINLIYTN